MTHKEESATFARILCSVHHVCEIVFGSKTLQHDLRLIKKVSKCDQESIILVKSDLHTV